MKKILILGSFVAIFLASCGEASNDKAAKECNASDLVSATKCLCDLYNQLDHSDNLSDKDYDALNDKIDAFNALIDKAIEEEKYTNEELIAEGKKTDCVL